MPNTLAHAGAQGLATRTAVAKADLRWIYLGCVIPDVPWILQRAAHAMLPGMDPYLLRSYVIIQASLLGCVVLSAAAALLAQAFWRTWALLGGNAVLHLGLDAMQTKWGNGVHFFAPFSWDLTNWGLFWPESVPTYALTALGLLYIGWHWRDSVTEPPGLTWPGIPRLMGILVLLGGYFLGPLFLLQQPIEVDAHSLETLSRTHGKTGRPVEIDRARYVDGQGGHFLKYYGGRVRVEDLKIPSPATISIQGVFTNEGKVHVTDFHVHDGEIRAYASGLGIGLVFAVWLISIINNKILCGYEKEN